MLNSTVRDLVWLNILSANTTKPSYATFSSGQGLTNSNSTFLLLQQSCNHIFNTVSHSPTQHSLSVNLQNKHTRWPTLCIQPVNKKHTYLVIRKREMNIMFQCVYWTQTLDFWVKLSLLCNTSLSNTQLSKTSVETKQFNYCMASCITLCTSLSIGIIPASYISSSLTCVRICPRRFSPVHVDSSNAFTS